MTYCKTVRAELPFVIGFTDPMDMWKLYRKYCAALFFKDKDPSIQDKTPGHFDLASPLQNSVAQTRGAKAVDM